MTLQITGSTGGATALQVGQFSYPVTGASYDVTVPAADEAALADQDVPVSIGTASETIRRTAVASDFGPVQGASASVSGTTITVSWTGQADAESYDIERSLDGGAFAYLVSDSASPYTDSGLSDGSYRYRLKAVRTVNGTPEISAAGPESSAVTVTAPVAANSINARSGVNDPDGDDAEETISTGAMSIASSDLDLGSEGPDPTIVGIRFPALQIPQGANITNAYVQFTAAAPASGTCDLTISAQRDDTAGLFTLAAGNLSSRPRTSASASWSVPNWNAAGDAAAAQRTSALTAIIQEIVTRPGWVPGNAMALFFTGTGTRPADSMNKATGPTTGPLLRVEWS